MLDWHKFSGVCAISFILAACTTSGEQIGGPLRFEAAGTAVGNLQRINRAAARCWMNTPAFRGLGMVPELDTRVGKPRILILARGQNLPKWVIEGSGAPAKFVTYGPLTNTPLSARMNDDVIRWSGGNTSCRG